MVSCAEARLKVADVGHVLLFFSIVGKPKATPDNGTITLSKRRVWRVRTRLLIEMPLTNLFISVLKCSRL